MSTLTRLWNDEEGANAMEYALIAAVVAVILIVAMRAFGVSVSGLFGRNKAAVDQM